MDQSSREGCAGLSVPSCSGAKSPESLAQDGERKDQVVRGLGDQRWVDLFGSQPAASRRACSRHVASPRGTEGSVDGAGKPVPAAEKINQSSHPPPVSQQCHCKSQGRPYEMSRDFGSQFCPSWLCLLSHLPLEAQFSHLQRGTNIADLVGSSSGCTT